MFKKFIVIAMVFSLVLSSAAVCCADYSWAEAGVNYCLDNKIMEGTDTGELMLDKNLTRAQMAKMLTVGFGLSSDVSCEFNDVSPTYWSYPYAAAIQNYMKIKGNSFNGDEYVTREEFAATLVLASGLTEGYIRNPQILDREFSDADKVSPEYKKLMSIAVERAYMRGSYNMINPKNLLTRAEVCTLLYRVIESKNGNLTFTWEDLGVRESYTPLTGAAQVTVEQAQSWAKSKGAADIFIEIAPTYWKYGEITGLRPEILYAQAAKETGYGKYGGAVLPEMNNWAGIKIKNPQGDRTEDHETFATPDDGVRAHFNHMSAYVGLEPVGEPHDRYYVVKSIDWAGSVKNLEALGGRWCPDLYYGYSILHDCLDAMTAQ